VIRHNENHFFAFPQRHEHFQQKVHSRSIARNRSSGYSDEHLVRLDWVVGAVAGDMAGLLAPYISDAQLEGNTCSRLWLERLGRSHG